MSESTIWTHTIRRVGDDNWDGDCIEIGPDADGLNCVEIRYRQKDGKFSNRLSVPPEIALLLADAIVACGRELEAEAKREKEGAAK